MEHIWNVRSAAGIKRAINRSMEALLPLAGSSFSAGHRRRDPPPPESQSITAYQAMLNGAFGSLSGTTQTLVKATPLLLVGLGVVHRLSRRGDQHRRRGAADRRRAGDHCPVGQLSADWPGLLLLPLA